MSDKWLPRLVILLLGVIIISSALVCMHFNPDDPPVYITSIGSGALGALAGILAPTNPNSKNNPQ